MYFIFNIYLELSSKMCSALTFQIFQFYSARANRPALHVNPNYIEGCKYIEMQIHRYKHIEYWCKTYSLHVFVFTNSNVVCNSTSTVFHATMIYLDMCL